MFNCSPELHTYKSNSLLDIYNWMSHRYLSVNISQQSFYTCPPQIEEEALATHSSTLAWKIPWMEEPGGLQSMGLLRVGHN